MKVGTTLPALLAIALPGLAACDGRSQAASATDNVGPKRKAETQVMASVPTNAWVGRWIGPEGTFLEIANNGGPYSGRYTITNRYSLDSEATFEALADRTSLVFTRNGQKLRLTAGSGDETGMKWLAGKSSCLIVAPGEGYCRP
jgi:hypothetical protein